MATPIRAPTPAPARLLLLLGSVLLLTASGCQPDDAHLDWVQVASDAPWGPRSAHTSLVFGDRLWIVGSPTSGACAEVWTGPR